MPKGSGWWRNSFSFAGVVASIVGALSLAWFFSGPRRGDNLIKDKEGDEDASEGESKLGKDNKPTSPPSPKVESRMPPSPPSPKVESRMPPSPPNSEVEYRMPRYDEKDNKVPGGYVVITEEEYKRIMNLGGDLPSTEVAPIAPPASRKANGATSGSVVANADLNNKALR